MLHKIESSIIVLPLMVRTLHCHSSRIKGKIFGNKNWLVLKLDLEKGYVIS
jgi:hypothetical protein